MSLTPEHDHEAAFVADDPDALAFGEWLDGVYAFAKQLADHALKRIDLESISEVEEIDRDVWWSYMALCTALKPIGLPWREAADLVELARHLDDEHHAVMVAALRGRPHVCPLPGGTPVSPGGEPVSNGTSVMFNDGAGNCGQFIFYGPDHPPAWFGPGLTDKGAKAFWQGRIVKERQP
jgi:hypothetical protein